MKLKYYLYDVFTSKQFGGGQVSVVEMANQVLVPVDYPIAALLQQHIRSKGVELLLNTAVAGFERTDSGVNVQLKNGK